jgi:hypothetical protein
VGRESYCWRRMTKIAKATPCGVGDRSRIVIV